MRPSGAALGDDGDRQVDASAFGDEVEHDLLETAALEDDVLHVVDGRVVLPEPRAGLGDEGPERRLRP